VGLARPVQAGGGFGLTQIRERLATLYGDAASLQFEAASGEGARAVVRIPLPV
jgi:LytS/YehU family sensor histidine kinase